MTSTPSIASVCTLAFRVARPRPAVRLAKAANRAVLQRGYADSTNDPTKLPEAPKHDPKGPNAASAEHVSEEAAKTAKIMGDQGPDIEGQGTPVQDILKKEPDTRKNAPNVLKNEVKRSFSTLARRMQPEVTGESSLAELDPSMIPTASQRAVYMTPSEPRPTTLKFHMPSQPAVNRHKKRRNPDEPIVEQLTKLMMRHGELGKAQKYMANILTILRTSPAPKYMNGRPLLPDAPPAFHLPLDPVRYLTLAIDSVAPLTRLRSEKGAAGGGAALLIPVPLNKRQRRRRAFEWILDSVSTTAKRRQGKYTFSERVAQEIIAIVEGRSGVWTKRDTMHKMTTRERVNVNYFARRRRR